MVVVQELNFPAAPWMTFKPNAWKAVQKQLHFPLLSFSLEMVPDTTSALLGTKETGKVTVEHPEDEQTVKESALCADLCAAWLNFGVNIVIVCAPHGGKTQWSICAICYSSAPCPVSLVHVQHAGTVTRLRCVSVSKKQSTSIFLPHRNFLPVFKLISDRRTKRKWYLHVV